MQGQAQASALDTQAAIARQNATLTRQAGSANAAREEILGSQKMGGIQGAAAAGGVTQSGSVLDVMHTSAMNSELDRLNIVHGAEVRAINYSNQASLDELGAKSAMNSAYINAVGSIMMGGSRAYGNMPKSKDTDSGDMYETDYSAGDSMSGGDEMSMAGGAGDAGGVGGGAAAGESGGAAMAGGGDAALIAAV